MQRENAFRASVADWLTAKDGKSGVISARLRASPLARRVAEEWGARARIEGRLVWDDRTKVVAVGGSTLGGSGKTRLAMACVLALADEVDTWSNGKITICLLGHAYKAAVKRARVVHPADDAHVVGDEALACARRLVDRANVHVAVAPTRQAGLDFAARSLDARIVVVDGLIQAAPRRADLALLATDIDQPWSVGTCPPLGDLRASIDRLRMATDRVVPMTTAISSFADAEIPGFAPPKGPVGLITALARPARIERSLGDLGLDARIHVSLGDHARPSGLDRARLRAAVRRYSLVAWVATDKCSAALARRGESVEDALGAPLVTLIPRRESLCSELSAALSLLLNDVHPDQTVGAGGSHSARPRSAWHGSAS